ncbi:uncharacterized protein GLRG_11617 [Colletotrichum graminicola M1.001]|uniref:Uncharacterized protein n=1 Tax=Colletotrichum graminicola (strain M1.001 / M2 / FGSC 10212) TaxID=645133 RepID=E3R034_COLGM|nr:uncharacterized protein GLRG_11617 [Colletotrichum graminicola M1.001]EFQ36472.1 hypothetical protein GLRG_11617 [Colletotrichum graminicola M1.001]
MADKERVRTAFCSFLVSSEATACAEVERRLALFAMHQHDIEDVESETEVGRQSQPLSSRQGHQEDTSQGQAQDG